MKRKMFLSGLLAVLVVILVTICTGSARADEAMIKYSHTPNIEDGGKQNGPYAANLDWHDVVTIPGADSLYVVVTYGTWSTNYECLCIWQGSHPEYMPYRDYRTSISGQIGGMDYKQPGHTVGYVVPGDTVTFGFDGCSWVTNEYGYHATIYGISRTDDVDHSVTFHAGENGSFSNGTDVNEVGYAKYIEYVTQYAHTSNLTDSGEVFDEYLTGSYRDKKNWTQAMTVPGAESLEIDLVYRLRDGGNYDEFLCVWPGDHPEYKAESNQGTSYGYFYNYYNDIESKVYSISGDSVTFGLYTESNWNRNDPYGYYAVVRGKMPHPRSVSGTYEDPVPADPDTVFIGWNTAADGSGENISVDDASLYEGDLYAVYSTATHTITFHSTDQGLFADSTDTHVVEYEAGMPTADKRISRTVNVDRDGTQLHPYASGTLSSNWSMTDVVTIPNAEALYITINYGTHNVSSNYACIWAGSHPTNTASAHSGSSFTGKLGGGYHSGTYNRKNYVISGDTATFGFIGQTGSYNSEKYGYYAVIEATVPVAAGSTYEEPVALNSGLRFLEWNTEPDGSGTAYKNPGMAVGVTDLYAMYEDNTIIEDTYRNVDWKYRNDGMLILGVPGPMQIYEDKEHESYSSWPWYRYMNTINSVRIDGPIAGMGSMNGMFYGEKISTIDLSQFDLSAVTEMRQMFYRSSLVSIDLSNRNLSSLISADSMFDSCSYLESVDLSHTHADQAIDFSSMFQYDSKLTTINLELFTANAIENVQRMFNGCNRLNNLDLSTWNFSNVTTCGGMYGNCSSLTRFKFGTTNPVLGAGGLYIDLPMGWSYALEDSDPLVGPYNSATLAEIYSKDIQGFWIKTDVSNQVYAVYDTDTNTLYFVKSDMELETGLDTAQTVVSESGTSVSGIVYAADASVSIQAPMNAWSDVVESVEHVVVLDSFMMSGSSNDWFRGMSNCIDMDLVKINPSQLYSCYGMFKDCTSLVELDLSTWDPALSTDFSSMFENCSALTKLYIGKMSMVRSSTQNLLFEGCSALEELDIYGLAGAYINMDPLVNLQRVRLGIFNTSSYRLAGAPARWTREDGSYGPYDASHFGYDYGYTSANVATEIKDKAGWWIRLPGIAVVYSTEDDNTLYFFLTEDSYLPNTTGTIHRVGDDKEYTGTLYYLPDMSSTGSTPTWANTNASTRHVKVLDRFEPTNHSVYSWFRYCAAQDFDISKLDVSNVTIMERLFEYANITGNVDLSSWDTHSVTNFNYMCYDASMKELDLTGWEVSQITSITYMFNGFKGHLIMPDMHWDNCTGLGMYFFAGGDENTVRDIQRWSFGAATDMSEVFHYTRGTTNAQDWNLDGVEDMSLMMYTCGDYLNLQGWHSNTATTTWAFIGYPSWLYEVDVTGWDMPALKTVEDMFANGYNLRKIIGLETWDVSNIENMQDLFYYDPALDGIDLSTWKTSSLIDCSGMFYDCTSLTYLDLENFDMSHVTSLSRMFTSCTALKEVKVSGWDFRSLTNISDLFYGCSSLEHLDLSDWDVSTITNISYLVGDCSKLISIDMSGWNLGENVSSYGIFDGDNVLQSITVEPCFKIIADQDLVAIPSDSVKYQWVDDSGSYGPYSTEDLIENYPQNFRGTWLWDLPSPAYYIVFEAPDGSVGSMPSLHLDSCFVDATLSKNTFRRPGANFLYWKDNIKNYTYEDGAVVPACTYSPGDIVVLTAVFDGVGGEGVHMEDGGFTLTLHKDEMAVFDGLPANLLYQVYEDTPFGWTLIAESNTSGTIEAEQRSAAGFVNQYNKDECFVILSGDKFIDERMATEGEFQFELLDENGTLIDTTTTRAGGDIVFDKLVFTAEDIGKEILYTVREVIPTSDSALVSSVTDGVTYDVHEEHIKVIVSYQIQGDGALYSHTGNLVDGGEKIVASMPVDNYAAIYHTANIRDDGSRDMTGLRPDGSYQGDYVNNQPYAAVVNVRNAVKLHVKLTYSNPRGADGLFGVWAGEHQEVRSGAWTTECDISNAIHMYSGSDDGLLHTAEFDVAGDSLSLRYVSEALSNEADSYTENSNFGYYMEITVDELYKNGGQRADGTPISDYINNQEYVDMISIPGADQLHVVGKYSAPRDDGVFTIADDDNNLLKSYTGEQNVLLEDEFDADGNTIRIVYRSPALPIDDVNYTQYSNYGYSVVVTPVSLSGTVGQVPFSVGTPNISSDGVQNGNYATGRDYVNVVSIPGATKLNFALKYNMGSNDILRIFEGNHPEYAYDSAFDSVVSVTGESDQAMYSVDGDVATIVFHADADSEGGNGYGYYATYTSNNDLSVLVAEVIYDDDGIVYVNESTGGKLKLSKACAGLESTTATTFIYELVLVQDNGQQVDENIGLEYYIDESELPVYDVRVNHIACRTDGSEIMLASDHRLVSAGDAVSVAPKNLYRCEYDYNDFSTDESFVVQVVDQSVVVNMYYQQLPFTLTVHHVAVDSNWNRIEVLDTDTYDVGAMSSFDISPNTYADYIYARCSHELTADSVLHGIMPDKDLTINLLYKPVQTMTLSRVGDNNSSSLKIVLPDDFTGLPTYQYGDVNFVNGKAILTLTGSEDALVLKLPDSPTVLHFTATGGSPLDPFAIVDNDGTLIVYQSSGVDQYDLTVTDGYSFEFMGEAFPIACSHTPNIGDDGVQLSNYANNWKLADVVTIPGATSLHLIITYGGESVSCDWVCAWAGNHPDYDPYDYSSSLTGRLGGGNHTDPANTKEFDVSGDTVTFIYKSDGSSCGDGYGYYAVIQGIMPEP